MNKENRLRKNTEFNRVYKFGKNYWNRNLVIYVCKRENESDPTRIGYTITKKIGNAVMRNKIRRRMKEIIRLNFHKIESGYDIIIIPKRNIVDLSYQDLESSMIHIMSLARIYNKR